MPQYVGDQATVMPSNTQAIMHWSNLFARQKAAKDAQMRQMQIAEQQRRASLAKYFGDKLMSKDFNDAYDYQTVVNKGLDNTRAYLEKSFANGTPVDQIYMNGTDMLAKTMQTANKAKQLRANIAAGVAGVMKVDKYVDPAALTQSAVMDAAYNPDGTLKPIDEVNPAAPWVQNAYNNHRDVLYDPRTFQASEDEFWKRQTTTDVNDNDTYDANKNQVRRGFSGKLPPQGSLVFDPSTNLPLVKDNGQPVLMVRGTENYRLPGASTDLKDENGKTIPVLNEDAFKMFYTGPMAARIDGDIKDQLAKSGQGPDSDYADMLRRNDAHRILQEGLESRYQFKFPKDQSNDLKAQLFSQRIRDANLGLRRQQVSMQKAKFAKQMQSDGSLPLPLMDKYDKAMQWTQMPGQGGPVQVININDIDNGDYQIITGSPKPGMPTQSDDPALQAQIDKMKSLSSLFGGKEEKGIKPFEVNGNKYLVKNPDGTWVGEGSEGKPQVIDYEAAYNRQLKYLSSIKKQDQQVKRGGGVRQIFKNGMNKVKKAIKLKSADNL